MTKAMKRKRPPVRGVTVYPRGKTFAYNVDLEPDPLTGKVRYEYKGGFPTEEEAWAAALKAKAAIDAGRRVPPSRRTVAAFLSEWLTSVKDSIKPSTYANYVDYIDAYVLPHIGKRRLQDVDVPVLNALYRHLLKAGRCKPDNNVRMFDYWQTRKLSGVEPKPKEIAEHCKVSIHAAPLRGAAVPPGRAPTDAGRAGSKVGPEHAPPAAPGAERRRSLGLPDLQPGRTREPPARAAPRRRGPSRGRSTS